MKRKLLNHSTQLLISLLLLFFWAAAPASAAPPRQEPPDSVYTVQPGDTLMRIALRYNLRLTDLILANHLLNQNLIYPGQQLILPGIAANPTLPPPIEPSLNESTQPSTFNLQPSTFNLQPSTHMVQPGETLFAIATAYGLTVEALMQANNLVNPNLIQTGQTLRLPGGLPSTVETWPAPFTTIELSEPVISQGRTLVIKVNLADSATLSGQFEGRPIFFNQTGPGQFWGITPLHAMEPPNTYPISLTATQPDGSQTTATPNVSVVEGPYGQENIQLDQEHSQLLNADLIQQEQQTLAGYWSQVSPRPRWDGPFGYPLESVRLTSYFGTRRTYNESVEISFHGGLDFGGETGTPVYTPAAGRVAMAQPLVIRGNAVLIDHGLGLFSGYWHLNQIAVAEGQEVQRGDLIGYLGGTGLATGPHLHWEMRLNGIAVEPLQWVQQVIP